jgi:hypothetical protein
VPQNIVDVTDQIEAPWYERIDVFLKSKKVFKGTFCFPFGSGFGCGVSKTVRTGEELNLSATLGAELKGITGEVTIGYAHTQEEEWAYSSKPCEFCRPDICFPDATLTIVERYIVPFPYAFEFEHFRRGERSQIENNCTPNDPLCNCAADPKTALLPGGRAVMFQDSAGFDTLVMRPTGPYKPIGELPPATAIAAAVSEAIDAQWGLAQVGADRPVALGVLEPGRDITYLRPLGRDAPAVSLLSLTARDYLTGGQEARLDPRTQPVVVVTQCNPRLSAEVSLNLEGPDGLTRRSAEPAVAHGAATVIAATFDFGADGLAPDTRALLDITLTDPNDPCLRIVRRDEFRVPPVPWKP